VRILYFTRDFTPHDYRFLTTLGEQGHEVLFLRLERGSRQVEDRALPPSVRHIAWRGGQKPFRWRDLPGLVMDLRRVLEQEKPDILHAGPIQTVAFIAALSGFRPLVSMSWGSDLLRDAHKNTWYRWITRFTLRQSTVLVGDCAQVRNCAISYGCPDKKIFTFPWGIDLKHFAPGANDPVGQETPALRARLGWQDQFVLLSLRSWEPVYGIDILLRGFASAATEDARLRLLMMGGGSQAGLVHKMIQDHDLADRVHLGGQISQANLPGVYQAADLYLSASRSDGSSVSLMESLASGLPVLVSDIPSNLEWVVDGEPGWLFRDGDDRDLAEKILAAARQPLVLETMRRAARAQAESKADWSKNFLVLLQAYDQALKASK
jgi:L-malate glycosyltransferase